MEKNVLERSDYVGEIVSIIRSTSTPNVMREKLEDYHENDIAEVLPSLSIIERKKLYRILNIAMLSNILEYAETDDACKYLEEMDLRKAAQVIENMESDVALVVLRALDKTKRTYIMSVMSDDSKKDIALMASFDESEIGSKMTTNFITLTADLSIKQAMHSLIEQAPTNDNISTLFVIDEEGNFFGAIDLKELIIARQGTDLNSLIMTSYPYVYATESIDDCIENLKDYSEDLIPVLDNNNRIIGVITSQSIIEVVDDAMGEDYAKLAGLTAEEDLKEPLIESMKKRLPWLFILLGLGMIVSTVVGLFEQVVSQLTIIMCFQSLILDMAGNVGTQSLAVTIRVLMDESLTGKQKAGLVLKEMRIGFSNGLLLGVSALLVLGLYIYIVKINSAPTAFAISAVIGFSLIVAMVISSAVGTLIPLFFNKIHVDPAVASGPLITTINDLVAVVTYYGLSWIFIIKILSITNVG
jgi:magnesium transporter